MAPDKPAHDNDLTDRRKRARQLPDAWQPNENHYQIARDLGRDIDRETERFRDHALSKRRTLVDWDAGFRNWLRSDYGPTKTRDSPNNHAAMYRAAAAEARRREANP
ncbi:MAG: hypothetical protein GEU88_20910 [Solirubrobacterales bacterium]|nr:hypothetical protein [Solirubrobacterales bacterium]